MRDLPAGVLSTIGAPACAAHEGFYGLPHLHLQQKAVQSRVADCEAGLHTEHGWLYSAAPAAVLPLGAPAAAAHVPVGAVPAAVLAMGVVVHNRTLHVAAPVLLLMQVEAFHVHKPRVSPPPDAGGY